jgi:hypothetical protein
MIFKCLQTDPKKRISWQDLCCQNLDEGEDEFMTSVVAGIDLDQQHRDLIREYTEDPDRVRADTNLMRPWEIEDKVLARAPEE